MPSLKSAFQDLKMACGRAIVKVGQSELPKPDDRQEAWETGRADGRGAGIALTTRTDFDREESPVMILKCDLSAWNFDKEPVKVQRLIDGFRLSISEEARNECAEMARRVVTETIDSIGRDGCLHVRKDGILVTDVGETVEILFHWEQIFLRQDARDAVEQWLNKETES